MSVFKKQFKTKKTKDETKMFVNKSLIELTVLKSIVNHTEWVGDKLLFDSKLGKGYFLFADNLIEVEIHLSFIGKIAIKQLESTLDEEFVKLEN